MEIRPLAWPADRNEWLRLRHALWPGETDDALLAEMEAQVDGRSGAFGVFVAAGSNGRLAGFIEVGTRNYAEGCDTSPVAYIEGWYVDPEWRRQGVGSGLVAAAEHWGRVRGLAEIGSDTWLDNDVSHAAHLALGYEEVERLIVYRKPLKET